eukprot:SAG31_NODE_2072_length_6514_cov_19.807171_4_plen_147_part_00
MFGTMAAVLNQCQRAAMHPTELVLLRNMPSVSPPAAQFAHAVLPRISSQPVVSQPFGRRHFYNPGLLQSALSGSSCSLSATLYAVPSMCSRGAHHFIIGAEVAACQPEVAASSVCARGASRGGRRRAAPTCTACSRRQRASRAQGV